MPLEKTRRVCRSAPCSVCGRTDWCLVAGDGRYAVCMRRESSRPARGGLGGWVHRLDDSRPTFVSPFPAARSGKQASPPASPERCHTIYRRLQVAASLRGSHAFALQARGFSRLEIQARGYGSLPLQGRAALARRCHDGDPDLLAGVPGFFRKPGAGGGEYWTLAGRPGVLIPCRGPDGRIRAFTLRPDEPGPDGPKYTWFSSTGRPGGTGSGIHCHVARPSGHGPSNSALWVTEGPLKADLASQRLGAVVLAIPGVSGWARALPDVTDLLPGGGRVVIALDADWRTNPTVHGAVWGLALACSGLGYHVEVALWDPTHKGLDELLAAGRTPDLRGPQAIPAPAWPLKVSSRILAPVPTRPAAALSLPAMRQTFADAFRTSPCPRSA